MDIQKPRVTEFRVRMDCNGCVQKIRKALHGIQGICEVYPDIAQQKLTVIGWADPERIVKAIRKTRKTVTICSHLEPSESAAQPPDQPPDGGPAAQETPNPTPSEVPPPPPPPAEAAPQPEAAATPTGEPPKDQPPQDNPQPEPAAAPADANPNAGQQPLPQTSGQKDVGEVHVIHHHPPDYGHRYGYGYGYGYGGGPCSRVQYPVPNSQYNLYQNSQPFHHEPLPPQPAFATHSYNMYKPAPHVTEYEYVHSPPRYTNYSRIDHYNEDYYSNYNSNGGGSSSSYNNSNGNGNITSIFSDENPNACRIM